MKPGNRHVCEMVPNHSEQSALKDERMETYILISYVQPFCLSAGRFFICMKMVGIKKAVQT